MYKRVHVCINELLYEYIHICMITYNHAYVYVHIYVHVYTCIDCIYVWMYVYECMRDEHTWLWQCRHAQLLCLCLRLCLCLCLLVSSLLLPFFSKWGKEKKGEERKGKERDGMRSSVFSILYVLLGTCLCNVLVQIMKEVFNHHSTPHSGTWQCGHR